MFEFKRSFALHEGGGKFYQIYQITGNGRRIIVTHWGKAHPGATYTPKNFGQTKYEEDSTGRSPEGVRKQNVKSKRGYGSWETETRDFDNLDELGSLLTHHFKSVGLNQIISYIRGGEEVPSESFEPVPATPKKAEPEPDRGELWGAW